MLYDLNAIWKNADLYLELTSLNALWYILVIE